MELARWEHEARSALGTEVQVTLCTQPEGHQVTQGWGGGTATLGPGDQQ